MTVNGVLISIISQRVALGVHVSTTACGIYCRLSSRRGRLACFFLPQDENSLINCFCEKVTNRKNKQVTFFYRQGDCFNNSFFSKPDPERKSQPVNDLMLINFPAVTEACRAGFLSSAPDTLAFYQMESLGDNLKKELKLTSWLIFLGLTFGTYLDFFKIKSTPGCYNRPGLQSKLERCLLSTAPYLCFFFQLFVEYLLATIRSFCTLSSLCSRYAEY